jgi:hypothetical protein
VNFINRKVHNQIKKLLKKTLVVVVNNLSIRPQRAVAVKRQLLSPHKVVVVSKHLKSLSLLKQQVVVVARDRNQFRSHNTVAQLKKQHLRRKAVVAVSSQLKPLKVVLAN